MSVPPPEIAAIRERAEKANAADWSVAAVIAVTVPAIREFITHAREDVPWLLAALERVTAERDEARAWRDLAERSRVWFANALEAAEAERARLREALERIVNDRCVKDGGEFVSDGSQVRCKTCNCHRGVVPVHVYVGARAVLAGGTDAAPPQDEAPKDTALAGDARYRGAPQRKPGVREQESPVAAPPEQKP